MDSTRTVKRSAAVARNPLERRGIEQHVLSYLGPGHWLFAAAVCSLWKRIYENIASTEVLKVQTEPITVPMLWRCVPRMTLLSAILASPSRLRCAHELGLPLGNRSFVMSYAIGLYTDIATIATAEELGIRS
jgi:hypothetical protein